MFSVGGCCSGWGALEDVYVSFWVKKIMESRTEGGLEGTSSRLTELAGVGERPRWLPECVVGETARSGEAERGNGGVKLAAVLSLLPF